MSEVFDQSEPFSVLDIGRVNNQIIGDRDEITVEDDELIAIILREGTTNLLVRKGECLHFLFDEGPMIGMVQSYGGDASVILEPISDALGVEFEGEEDEWRRMMEDDED
jgi:hypothetical protein